jgi:hypothetical protein
MRYLIILLFFTGACQSAVQTVRPCAKWLDQYAVQSVRTDPGEYAFMYRDLPPSLDSLCDLVKCQLIHPLEAREMNLPMEEAIKYGHLTSVEEMLQVLLARDDAGLTCKRKTEDRLVLACHHHAMLLTSILRDRGIPVRMRAGYSRYFEKQFGVRFGHVICEVWDEESERWRRVDPDRKIVDIPADGFEYAGEAWGNINRKKVDPSIYLSSISAGVKGILNLMILDAAFLVKDEKIHWDLPEIALHDIRELEDLDEHTMGIMDELAASCGYPDLKMKEIENMYRSTDLFRSAGIDFDSYMEMIMDRE